MLLTCTVEEDELNTSDHLPIHVLLQFSPLVQENRCESKSQVNWCKAKLDGPIGAYESEVSAFLSQLPVDHQYGNVEELDADITRVAAQIQSIALRTLPRLKPPQKRFPYVYDKELQELSKRCRETWRQWTEQVQVSYMNRRNKQRSV